MSDPETARLYQHLKQLWTGRKSSRRTKRQLRAGESQPFDAGRDPLPIALTLDTIAKDFGWSAKLAHSTLLLRWAELVGPELAEHTTATDCVDGVLLVACDSTAWATQLRLMRNSILAAIALEHPDAGVTSIRFIGPDVPSWKHGFRSVPGRGPRDTYG